MTKNKNKFAPSKFSMDKVLANSKFDYCRNMKWFLIAPIVIIIVGIILLFTVGFNLGLDFTGGSIIKIYTNDEGVIEDYYQYHINENSGDYNLLHDKIEAVLKEHGLTINSYRTTTMDVKDVITGGLAVEVRYQNIEGQDGSEIAETNKLIRSDLQEIFGYKQISVTENYTNAVSAPEVVTATASSELLMNAFIAMLVAIVLILVYVAFRFEITSGLAAVLALFHDLLVMTSLVLIFRITINSSFVAALVTILGYSINNTIIIFDRIRENIKSGKFDKAKNSEIANSSVKETMTRSILTTLTTFITIAMVAIIGVSDIREFAVPILIGILAGFYSSVFITPGLWAIAYRKPKKNKKKATV